MKKNWRPIRRYESPFHGDTYEDPAYGRGYKWEPHGRFKGQRIGGSRRSDAAEPLVSRDFWDRSRNIQPPIDHRKVLGQDRFGGKFFGPQSRESIQVDRVASTSLRSIPRPDFKPQVLLGGEGAIRFEGNGADWSMEFGRTNQFRVAGWIRPREQFPRGEVRFIHLDNHPLSSRLGKFRSAGNPLAPKDTQLRRGKGIRIGVISIAGEPDLPIAQHLIRDVVFPGRADLRGREGNILRFRIPPTIEVTETRTPKVRSPVASIFRPWGGDYGSYRFGSQYDERTELHAITIRRSTPTQRRPDHGTGSRWIQIRHPQGEAWTLPGTFRSTEAPPADRPLAIGRGTRLASIPRPLGVSWTFPFRFRFIDAPPAARKLATGRGFTASRIPHPEGFAKTDPWRFRLIQTVLTSAMIRDRIAGSRRWGSQSREIFDTTDTSRLPIYIDLVWDNDVTIEVQYEPEIDIDLEVA